MSDDFLRPIPDWLAEAAARRKIDELRRPELVFPWWRPCTVQVLLVTDGGLDFGPGDFGLSTFVGVLLNDGRHYVRFELTLAHIRPDVSDAQVMQGAPGIARSIKGFRFDDPDHFDPDRFDEVWLFGIEPSYAGVGGRQGPTLDPGELVALSRHMNRGGGLFATGDHADLGLALSSAVDRARGMRHWMTYGNDEVSMGGPWRNDTNVVGHDPGSHFFDQSDDVPQTIDLELYRTRAGLLFDARYPHPILCGRTGRIDVFPDHPHEGECRLPDDLGGACADGSTEYPDATDGTGQVVPEIVAHGRVPAGNDARIGGPTKQQTRAHSFPLISVYDGHRAGVGRVVCDSTWHHFVNVNLIGMSGSVLPGESATKNHGFLSSPSGRAALDLIRDYYVNVAVWISTPARLRCMQTRTWWHVIWNGRVVEAALTVQSRSLADVPVVELYNLGIHAQDVLGRAAGRCQTLQWAFPILDRVWPEIRPWIDPWWREEHVREDVPLPVVDPSPIVAVVLGGAVAALHESFPYPQPEEVDDERLESVMLEGAQVGLERVRAYVREDVEGLLRLLG